MTRRSFKKLIGILLFLCIALCGVLYFIYRDIAVRNEKILVMENDLSTLNARQDYLVSTQHYLESIKPDLDKVDNSIVAKGEEVTFIENLEALAHENNLDIDIGNLATTDNDKVGAANATILGVKGKVKGSWLGQYLFLSELESWPVKVKINSYALVSSMQENPDPKAQPVWEGTFDISVMEYK